MINNSVGYGHACPLQLDKVDIVISDGHGPISVIECKSGKRFKSTAYIKAFQAQFSKAPIMVASLVDTRTRKIDDLKILSWKNVIKKYR